MKYILGIVSIFSGSIYFLSLLLKKYATLTFEHLWQNCKIITSNFLTTGAHYIGFGLTTLILVITFAFLVKTILSYIKTQARLKLLLEKRIFFIPKKAKKILEKHNIQKETTIIIGYNHDLALTIGWLKPKIVVSLRLIKRLSGKKLEAVMLHEYYHLKNRHPLLLIVGETLSSSLLILPLLKDLTRKMRSVLEKEADFYVFRKQKTVRYLNLALNQINPVDGFDSYPTFSRRNDHGIKKSSILITFIVILMGVFLLKFPGETHGIQTGETERLLNCAEFTCSVHCPTDDLGQNMSKSPAFQTSLAGSQNY